MIQEDYIRIDWMRKELYEMLYERKINYDTLKVYIDLIAKWRRECEKDDNHQNPLDHDSGGNQHGGPCWGVMGVKGCR